MAVLIAVFSLLFVHSIPFYDTCLKNPNATSKLCLYSAEFIEFHEAALRVGVSFSNTQGPL